MSSGRTKSKSKRASFPAFCEEKFCCLSDREPPVYKCTDCGTSQCVKCDEELHKDGDYFFHERLLLQLQQDGSYIIHPEVVPTGEKTVGVTVNKLKANAGLLGKQCVVSKLTLNPPVQQRSTTTTRRSGGGSNSAITTITSNNSNFISATTTTNSAATVRSAAHSTDKQPGKTVVVEERTAASTYNNNTTSCSTTTSNNKCNSSSVVGDQAQDIEQRSSSGGSRGVLCKSSDRVSVTTANCVSHETSQSSDLSSGDNNSESGEFHSLGLDSILDSDIVIAIQDMKGQSSKPSKKSKGKKSTSSLIQEVSAPSNTSPLPSNASEDFFSAPCTNGDLKDDTGAPFISATPTEFHATDNEDDEELVSNLLRSFRQDEVVQQDTKHSALTNYSSSVSRQLSSSQNIKSFPLIDESEEIKVSVNAAVN